MNRLTYFGLLKIAEAAKDDKKETAETPYITEDGVIPTQQLNPNYKGTAGFWDRNGAKLIGTTIGGLSTAALAKLFGTSNTAALLWALPGMGVGYVGGAAASAQRRELSKLLAAHKKYRNSVLAAVGNKTPQQKSEETIINNAAGLEDLYKAYFERWGYKDADAARKLMRAL